MLSEGGCLGNDATAGVQHQRGSVEDQLVLTSHQVGIGDGAPRLRDPLAEDAQALVQLAHVIGRGVQVENDLGTGCGHLAHRTPRHPRVLADRHADGDAGHVVQHGIASAGVEVAALIEHPVVGQLPLVVDALKSAIGCDAGCVLAPIGTIHKSHHRGTRFRLGRNVLHRIAAVLHKSPLEHQVFRGITGYRQLWEDRRMAPGLLGGSQRRENPLGVGVDIANH